MRGWIVYNQERLSRNVAYAQLYVAWGAAHGVALELKMSEDLEGPLACDVPDFAIFRCESFELRTQLEKNGCLVCNNARMGLLGYDKLHAYERMQELAVSLLPVEPLRRPPHLPSLAYPLVVKPRYGHGGQGVELIESEEDYLRFYEREVQQRDPRTWLAQTLGPIPGKDLRVYVMGTDVLAAMLRTAPGHELRSNYSLGGTACVYELSSEQRVLVNALIEYVGPGYYGLDFLFNEDGSLLFNEIEDIVGSRMLFDHTSIDVVDAHMSYVLNELGRRASSFASE